MYLKKLILSVFIGVFLVGSSLVSTSAEILRPINTYALKNQISYIDDTHFCLKTLYNDGFRTAENYIIVGSHKCILESVKVIDIDGKVLTVKNPRHALYSNSYFLPSERTMVRYFAKTENKTDVRLCCDEGHGCIKGIKENGEKIYLQGFDWERDKPYFTENELAIKNKGKSEGINQIIAKLDFDPKKRSSILYKDYGPGGISTREYSDDKVIKRIGVDGVQTIFYASGFREIIQIRPPKDYFYMLVYPNILNEDKPELF